MIESNTANVSYHEIRVRLAAFGHAWDQTGAADLAAFLPPADHPDYLEILHALVQRDLSERRARGWPARLEEYVRPYPALFADPIRIQDIAFEDYQARARQGEGVTPELFQLLFDVNVKDWPAANTLAALTPRPVGKQTVEESDFLQLSFMATHLSKRATTGYDLTPEVGEKFLDFDLVRELGRGAVGRVFLARQSQLANRLVVVKVSAHSDNEPYTLAQMQHTNIVPIYSVHLVGPLQVVCMPYFGSTTLAKIIADLGQYVRPLPTTGRDLLRALYERKAKSEEQRSDSSEPRAESEEQKAKSDEQRVKSGEQKAETKEQRAETKAESEQPKSGSSTLSALRSPLSALLIRAAPTCRGSDYVMKWQHGTADPHLPDGPPTPHAKRVVHIRRIPGIACL